MSLHRVMVPVPSVTIIPCRLFVNTQSDTCLYDSYPSYQLFSLTGGYTFADKYRLNVGIENLFDEEPPCVGADPNAFPFALDCSHVSGGPGATYDPLGRRFFISMAMDF